MIFESKKKFVDMFYWIGASIFCIITAAFATATIAGIVVVCKWTWHFVMMLGPK